MNSIGFRNFRRFKNMESIALGGVNMFVGGNNAGKSTVVKGILLLLDFLKYKKVSFTESPRFRFDGPGSHDVNIDTFSRALCQYAEGKEIVFNAQINKFTIEVCIYSARGAKKEEVSYADVKYITLFDSQTRLRLDFQVAESKAIVTEEANDSVERDGLNELKTMEEELVRIERRIEDLTTKGNLSGEEVAELIEKKQQKDNLGKAISLLNQQSDNRREQTITVSLIDGLWDNCSYVSNYIYGLISARTRNTKESKRDASERNKLSRYQSKLESIDSRFEKAVSSIRLEYVYSHDAGQRVLYNKKDENDYVSKSIHDFYSQRITSRSKLGKMMTSWLKDFSSNDIDSFKVESINGEAYRFCLRTKGKWGDLADMGRGTIQLTTLFVRVLSIIQKYRNEDRMLLPDISPIVLVEEPEQNLHPAWQSKLADIFYSIYKDYGIRFIIETHSEYMVRKSQVIVKEKINDKSFTIGDNPFNVYFFDIKEGPYQMEYRIDGNFSNEFGTGFFDEANKLLYDIL